MNIPGTNTSNIGRIDISNIGATTTSHIVNHEIKGEMFTSQLSEHDMFKAGLNGVANNQFDNLIKHDLINKLVNHLMESNYIEFTKQRDQHDLSTIYRARLFAVPNSDVQIIRKILK
jgi:hypothetical protein